MSLRLIVMGIVSFVLAASAMALTVDSGGVVTDWGVTPFGMANQVDSHTDTTWYTLQNGYSPINYPNVGHQPSPGLSSGGEVFDMEGMYIRVNSGHVQVLLIDSSGFSTTWGGNQYYLSDLFLTVDGQRYGMVTQSANQGLAAGSVYLANGAGNVLPLQSGSGSYLGNTTLVQNDYGAAATVADVAGPWAVSGSINQSLLLGTGTITSTTHNYGGAEDGTFLIQFDLDGSLLNVHDGSTLQAQMVWGCGNDVIRVNETVEGNAPVPEPALMTMWVIGMTAAYLYTRRRAKARLVATA